jgi:hypothetical protein
LFARLLADAGNPADAPAIFILGSPRTGSTLFYQCLVHYWQLPYFSNLANQLFARRPVLIAPAHCQVLPAVNIQFTSSYGKTDGAWQPSEASAVMRNWFRGGHPSQTASAEIFPGMEDHLVRTLAAIRQVFDAPVVIKNAWNCFRIAALARFLPRAFFVWIRRDLIASALSDLAARYVVQRDPLAWNSATPANVEELRRLPHWAQVVENQYEFARAIDAGLKQHADGRHAEIRYETFLRNPAESLESLAQGMSPFVKLGIRRPFSLTKAARSPRPYPDSDETNLRRYVAEHDSRLQWLRW